MVEITTFRLADPFSYMDSALSFAYFNLNVEDFGDSQDEVETAIAKRDLDREHAIRVLMNVGLKTLFTTYRGKYFHEWHHCLQNIFYPFQYLQSWRELRIALKVLGQLRSTEETYRLGEISLPQEWRETITSPTMIYGIDEKDGILSFVKREVEDLRTTDITFIDLVEEATSIFQFKAEIGAEGSGEAYRRWIREKRSAYSNVFRLLSRLMGGDHIESMGGPEGAYIALPALVQASFHTSWPATAFVSLINFTIESEIPILDLGCDLYYKIISSERRLNAPGALPDPEAPCQSDEYSYLGLKAYKKILSQTRNHTVYPLAKRYLELMAEKPELDTYLFHPYRKDVQQILAEEFRPLLTVIRIHHELLKGRDTLVIMNQKILNRSLPSMPDITYRDYLPEIKKRKDIIYSIFSDINNTLEHNCHHANCPYYPNNICRRWSAIPKTYSNCPFPKWFEQVTTRSLDLETLALKKLPQQRSNGGD